MEETSTTKLPEERVNKVTFTVKDLNPDEQPREKAEKLGCSYLTISELWALILRTGAQGLPVTQLCQEFMKQNDGSLHKLERRTRREILQFKGIGMTKCIQMEAVMELIKRYCNEDIPSDESISSSFQIFKRMVNIIGNIDHEEIWVIYLNRRNQVIKKMLVTSGTSVASIFDLKKIIKHALLENAEGIILCHNHPSGTLNPSAQDDAITMELAKACKLMKLNLLDHVIVTASSHYSYRDQGKL